MEWFGVWEKQVCSSGAVSERKFFIDSKKLPQKSINSCQKRAGVCHGRRSSTSNENANIERDGKIIREVVA